MSAHSHTQVENERKTKDNQIKTLNDEMAKNDENIAKLNKDKKNFDEGLNKAHENLQAEEDKANHLAKLKVKLEHSIDEVSGCIVVSVKLCVSTLITHSSSINTNVNTN